MKKTLKIIGCTLGLVLVVALGLIVKNYISKPKPQPIPQPQQTEKPTPTIFPSFTPKAEELPIDTEGLITEKTPDQLELLNQLGYPADTPMYQDENGNVSIGKKPEGFIPYEKPEEPKPVTPPTTNDTPPSVGSGLDSLHWEEGEGEGGSIVTEEPMGGGEQVGIM